MLPNLSQHAGSIGLQSSASLGLASQDRHCAVPLFFGTNRLRSGRSRLDRQA
ncbi:hypothetical protein RHECNPAF_1260099 [Rhizobium etli CNPAF512]|nr:hypothetical protein RHECNPAF_1260099 [Rhizobium etli CNPAF512]